MEKPTLIEIHFEKYTELPSFYYDTIVWVTDDDFDLLVDGNGNQIIESIKMALENEGEDFDPPIGSNPETFQKFIVKSIRCNKTLYDEDRISLTSLICIGNIPDIIDRYLYYEPFNPFGEGTKVYVKWMVGDDFEDYYLLKEDGDLDHCHEWSEEEEKVFQDFDNILNEGIEELIKEEPCEDGYLINYDYDIEEDKEKIDKYLRKGMMIE